MKAVILSAGKSKRLSSLTASVPKPMLKIAGKPILEHNILMCKKAGVDEIFINLHYLAEKITDYFGDGSKYDLKIIYNYEPRLLGTAGGLLYFLKWLQHEPYYVIYGDNYSNIELRDLKVYHDSVDSDFTIALHWVKDIQNSGFVELDKEGKVNKFIEKPKIDNIKGGWVNSGLYIINPGLINDMIKNRDFWMPFAPCIIHEAWDELLINPKKLFSPYMTIAFESTKQGAEMLDAASHPADQTLRPQMVTSKMNPQYH